LPAYIHWTFRAFGYRHTSTKEITTSHQFLIAYFKVYMSYMKRSQKKHITIEKHPTSLLLMVAIHVRDLVTRVITLSGARGTSG
jgi:hypothetical protein